MEILNPCDLNKTHIYNRLPKILNMGWDTFYFKFVQNLRDDTEKLDGATDFSTREITLERSLNHKDAKETIMHEILHCLFAGLGLEEKNFDGERFCINNEFLVSALTRQLQTLHNLNPQIMDLIYD